MLWQDLKPGMIIKDKQLTTSFYLVVLVKNYYSTNDNVLEIKLLSPFGKFFSLVRSRVASASFEFCL